MKRWWPLTCALLLGACAHLPTVGAGAAMTAAATLDLTSTYACQGCVERNPVSALLYDPKHPAWLYAGNYALVGGLTLATAELKHHRSPIWWLPASLATVAYVYSWQHNRGVVAALR